MPTPDLFSPLTVGQTSVSNRIFMAPMTRARAMEDGTPTPVMATYYRQRATAGLIVSEGCGVSREGLGWVRAPGIYTDAQAEEWAPVTKAVHDEGGRIFLQLWHMGRVSHPDFNGGKLPVAPSAIAADGDSRTPTGHQPYVVPRALETEDLPAVIDEFRQAAARAMRAGFDGVEIHGANGYLIDQFVRDGSNQRTDTYGGSIENRWRFPLEVVRAVVDKVGADRTAIRFSPVGAYNSMQDSDPVASFRYGAEQLAPLKLAYVHVIEAIAGMMLAAGAPQVHPSMRKALGETPFVLNGGFDLDTAASSLAAGEADAIAFGGLFLANPDLVKRFQNGRSERNAMDGATLYSPGDAGYIDYPALD